MTDFISSAIKQFQYYQKLGTQTMEQLPDDGLFWKYNDESNSIAILVGHLHGNMKSRWTDFLESDGEKKWRNREREFEPLLTTRQNVVEAWGSGWDCLFDTLGQLSIDDLEKIVYIRNQGHTVVEAINRQLSHYPYHVGQMVFIGKMYLDASWKSLSIPRGSSDSYNKEKFSEPKSRKHFTEDH